MLLAEEKETGIRELYLISGLKKYSFWLSWVNISINIFSTIIDIIIITIKKIFLIIIFLNNIYIFRVLSIL